jgi:hypothetical protein
METLAVAISNNANQIAYAIRAELDEELEKRARPVIDETAQAKIFLTPSISAFIKGLSGNVQALDEAAAYLNEQLLAFSFDKQMVH